MPSGKNWINFIYVNLAFALYIAGVFYYGQVAEIKANWPLYRCNPMYMPLADDIESNFVYCIQSMQTNMMGNFLQPLTFITNSMGSTLGNFTDEINSIRAMFNNVRGFISSIIQNVFGVFLNLIIEFQKITIAMKDLMGKTIGILVTFMYVLDGTLLTMQSSWNGPTGQLVRALGKCFHPDTKIQLKDGTVKLIKDVSLGDVLENGSIVYSVMKIDNKREPVPLYRIPNTGISGEDIFVTGSHLVFDKNLYCFIEVKTYMKSIKSLISTDYFCCLITNDHKIQIGKEVFWDWEDHFYKTKLYKI